MTKRAILVHKIWREYNKKENWEYSKFKGYPEDTYFGFASFADLKRWVLREFTRFYGKGLKKLHFKSM